MRIHFPLSIDIAALRKRLPGTAVIWALFTELLLISLFAFASLFSIEMLLPTFVSARINLAFCFGIILAAFVLHVFASLSLRIEITPLSKVVSFALMILLGCWGIALIALSLFKFPLAAGILIALSIIGSLAIFRKD